MLFLPSSYFILIFLNSLSTIPYLVRTFRNGLSYLVRTFLNELSYLVRTFQNLSSTNFLSRSHFFKTWFLPFLSRSHF
jgi:hypothetical protein